MRHMQLKINHKSINKESDNKFTDNMTSMIDLLLKSVTKISEIDQKIARIDNKESDNKFTDNMRSMIDLLLKSVNKISEIDQKIAQIDKVTTYLYGINTFKVCESELISKNKLNRLDDDNDKTKDKTKTKDNTTLDKINKKNRFNK